MTEQQRASLEKYRALIADFVSGRLSPAAFEVAYLSAFKNEQIELSAEVFGVLDRLFADVDAYCVEPESRGPGDIGDDELIERARTALEELRGIST